MRIYLSNRTANLLYLTRNQLTNTRMYHNISTLKENLDFRSRGSFCTTAVQGRRAAQPYKMRAEKKEVVKK